MVASNSVGFPMACLAWKGLAPPCAEILVWFVLQGHLNTKERLAKFLIISPTATICPFCVSAFESMDHILFGCMLS